MRQRSSATILLMLTVVLCAAIVVELLSGPYPLNLAKAVSGQGVDALVLWEIRLPRALLALLVGACLGLSGAAMQGLLRNPLAGPGLLGVSNCAALGAVMSFYFGLAGLAWYMLPLGGLAGAGLGVVLIFFLAGRQASVLGLTLAGVAISAVASSPNVSALRKRPVGTRQSQPSAINGSATQTSAMLRSATEPISQKTISLSA